MSNKNIKNELAYFSQVIKNMEIKEKRRQAKIKEHEVAIDEVILDKFLNDFNEDNYIEEQNLLSWIDLIGNEDLHKAVKGLPEEDQIFISYICKECCTQRELESVYNINHTAICKRYKNIINKIKKIMQGAEI